MTTFAGTPDRVTQFYDKADSDFDKQTTLQGYRTFFSTFNQENLKLTVEILNSNKYSAAEKEKFVAMMAERQKAIQNSFMNRVDYLVNEKCNK